MVLVCAWEGNMLQLYHRQRWMTCEAVLSLWTRFHLSDGKYLLKTVATLESYKRLNYWFSLVLKRRKVKGEHQSNISIIKKWKNLKRTRYFRNIPSCFSKVFKYCSEFSPASKSTTHPSSVPACNQKYTYCSLILGVTKVIMTLTLLALNMQTMK